MIRNQFFTKGVVPLETGAAKQLMFGEVVFFVIASSQSNCLLGYMSTSKVRYIYIYTYFCAYIYNFHVYILHLFTHVPCLYCLYWTYRHKMGFEIMNFPPITREYLEDKTHCPGFFSPKLSPPCSKHTIPETNCKRP